MDEKIYDLRCELTDRRCGENMKFATISREPGNPNSFTGLVNTKHEICIQQCMCANIKYIKKDGKCIENLAEIATTVAAVSNLVIQ